MKRREFIKGAAAWLGALFLPKPKEGTTELDDSSFHHFTLFRGEDGNRAHAIDGKWVTAWPLGNIIWDHYMGDITDVKIS